MNHKPLFFHGDDRHLSVTVTDIAMPGDHGVAKTGDYVVFVPGAIPGDRIKIRIVKRMKRYGYGEIVAMEAPSPYRVEAPCPHFGTCGGCTIQSMEYAKQLEFKNTHLRQSIKRLGKVDIPEELFEDITPSPATYWYRSKVELAFGNSGKNVVAGMRSGGFPAGDALPGVLSIPGCRIFNPDLKKIVSIVEDYVHAEGYYPYNGETRRGHLRHLIVRQSAATGTMMVIIETKGGHLHGMNDLFGHLNREVPAVTSLWSAINNRKGPYIDYGNIRHESGDLFIEESLAGLRFRIYPASFFQPNPAVAAALYGKINDIAVTVKHLNVLGLYCGMGPIELLLSRNAQKVAAIDYLKANIDNARENALINGITNCSFLAGKVEDIAANPAFKKPDIVVVDPPRAGISPQGAGIINDLSPGAVIYISCNPATLARDLGRLTTSGFSIERIAPFDMFPHTSHLETLTLLKKKKYH